MTTYRCWIHQVVDVSSSGASGFRVTMDTSDAVDARSSDSLRSLAKGHDRNKDAVEAHILKRGGLRQDLFVV